MYGILGPPGGCLLQRVETSIRFRRDDVCVVEYRGCYWEYFVLADGPPEERKDIHDFDLGRDGWGPMDVRRLLRRHRVQDRKGSARIELEKRFALGLGSVDAIAPRLTTPGGGSFGFLTEVDGVSTSAHLTLLDGRSVPRSDACPFGAPAVGHGSWSGAVWAASERFSYRLATQIGTLEAESYGPAEISEPDP